MKKVKKIFKRFWFKLCSLFNKPKFDSRKVDAYGRTLEDFAKENRNASIDIEDATNHIQDLANCSTWHSIYCDNRLYDFFTEPTISFAAPKDYCLTYFVQMADHLENLYQQAFIDYNLHGLSYGADLMKECREATEKLKCQYDDYSHETWFKAEVENLNADIACKYAMPSNLG